VLTCPTMAGAPLVGGRGGGGVQEQHQQLAEGGGSWQRAHHLLTGQTSRMAHTLQHLTTHIRSWHASPLLLLRPVDVCTTSTHPPDLELQRVGTLLGRFTSPVSISVLDYNRRRLAHHSGGWARGRGGGRGVSKGG
jgi:hypothetical protein